MTQLAHPIEDGLSRFTLIAGVGDGKKTACAMSLLNWIWRNGYTWTDAPDCAHPIIRAAVVAANDAPGTTAEMRAELVRLGERGVLDTWWVPTEVVAASLATERGAEPPSSYDRAVACLQRVAEWKEGPRERPNLTGANLTGANLAGADLADAHLAYANLTGAYLAGANLADAHLAYANLADAHLAYANLTGANLADAYLAYANLARANLARANLARADLTDAYLAYAYLADANLAGADLADAHLADAHLAYAYLAGANLARADLAGAYLARADLAGAYLAGANLAGAKGDASTRLPSGWEVSDSGIVVHA